MPDRHRPTGLTLDSTDALEQRLWEDLEAIPEHQPTERLRRKFYQQLNRAGTRRWWQIAADGLRHPLVPAFASLVLGLALGLQLGSGDPASSEQLKSLQDQVSALNTTVAVTLMQKGSTGERLQGVHVASRLSDPDPRLSRTLLDVAASDSSNAVRSAALSALGPHLNDALISAEVATLLTTASSPLVQLALAELIMRWGDSDLMSQLAVAAETEKLAPEVNVYVIKHLQRNQA